MKQNSQIECVAKNNVGEDVSKASLSVYDGNSTNNFKGSLLISDHNANNLSLFLRLSLSSLVIWIVILS